MRLALLAAASGLLLLGATATVGAHHSFASEFDIDRPVQLNGTVTKVEWINPHAWIYVDVKKPDGTVENWAVELGSPNTLVRRGLKKTDLPAGTALKVAGFQARDASPKANGVNVTLSDGRALTISSTGAGAPAN